MQVAVGLQSPRRCGKPKMNIGEQVRRPHLCPAKVRHGTLDFWRKLLRRRGDPVVRPALLARERRRKVGAAVRLRGAHTRGRVNVCREGAAPEGACERVRG